MDFALLNSNIRCIEIEAPLLNCGGAFALNSNIRCIEISVKSDDLSP